MSDAAWPKAGTYAMAARDVAAFFVDEHLRQGSFRTSSLGVPLGATGRNAVVFKVTAADGTHAVRCFTTAPTEGQERYDRLGQHLSRHPVPAIAAAEWVDEAVNVGGARLPMIRMEWVEGRTLDAYIREHLRDPARLRALADCWVGLLAELESAEIAHGDLQHGNVLVEEDGTVRLVDLDGVWTPTTSDLVPNEVGHANYQHPQRIARGYWSASVDAFSALSIALSLEAVCQAPELWEKHHDGANNLLLTEADYREPGSTPLWSAMSDLADPVPKLLGRLRRACESDVADLEMPATMLSVDRVWWEEFATPRRTSGGSPEPQGGESRRARERLGAGLPAWVFVLVVTVVAIIVLVGGVAVIGMVGPL